MKILQSAERVTNNDMAVNYVYQRSIYAYHEAAKIVSGDVLEIGTGDGYGIETIAPHTDRYVTVDKFKNEIVSDPEKLKELGVAFIQMTVPPLKGIPDNSFDYVISFQVIEHIEDDDEYVNEIYRVLKNGGKFIVTTPNIKMSLSRNPWHVREYTIDELDTLLKKKFQKVDKKGVFGNDKIMGYYEKNKESVNKIMRFDIFNLQYKLPRQILQIPYDVLNRYNRRKLLKNNTTLVNDIKMEDHTLKDAQDECIDLFYIAEKNV